MAGIPEVPSTSATEAGPLVMEEKVPYLDVRTEQEFEKEHVPGSINVPWFLDLTTKQVRLNRTLLLLSMPVNEVSMSVLQDAFGGAWLVAYLKAY